jgi:hypothetical protein
MQPIELGDLYEYEESKLNLRSASFEDVDTTQAQQGDKTEQDEITRFTIEEISQAHYRNAQEIKLPG